ncbi:hypothetical protein EGW08_021421 [Elysia chlorotica]|uniref:Cation-dependent mannose-6-phosphate receptor n=1 Tax=Elysia chlorotica TaxID=188477 RepID=A0A3S0ZMF5_ELYCH|nr:hypothetical protein EGW08_021421 [Elysia chlorotica]
MSPDLDMAPKALSILVVLASFPVSQAITKCTFVPSSCGCNTDKGLISLEKYADSPFSDQDPITSYTYHWSPCKDITKGSISASCFQEIPSSFSYDCGAFSTTKTSVKDGNAVFQLDASDGTRHSTITCTCRQNAADVFKFDSEDPMSPGNYALSLTGEICCPKSAPGPSGGGGGGDGGLSVGSVLLIIALVVVVVYLVGGVALQIGVRKAEGKERIPNLSFWTELPGLVVDGFRFTLSCGKTAQYSPI